MGQIIYIIVQVIWGLPQTLVGAIVFALHAGRPHMNYHGAVVTTWETRKGMSIGPFIFMHGPGSEEIDSRAILDSIDVSLLVHEYGHTIQSLILGPLYLPVIGLMSFIWSNLPALVRRRQTKDISYYSFWVERSANWLGERVLKQPSIGQAHVE